MVPLWRSTMCGNMDVWWGGQETPYRVIGKSWPFLSQSLPQTKHKHQNSKKECTFLLEKVRKFSLSNITWKHQILFPCYHKKFRWTLTDSDLQKEGVLHMDYPSFLTPFHSLQFFLSFYSSFSTPSPVFTSTLQKSLLLFTGVSSPMFFLVSWTEAFQALQTPEGDEHALNLHTEEIESALIQFLKNCGRLPLAPRSKHMHQSKHSFSLTTHSLQPHPKTSPTSLIWREYISWETVMLTSSC